MFNFITSFWTHSVDTITKDFQKMIARLEALEARLRDKANRLEYRAITLKDRAHDHGSEAMRAKAIRDKLSKLVS
jgi:hypothetical protein